MLTPKETGGNGRVYPLEVPYSALLEAGYSSTGAMADDATMAVCFKPTVVNTTKPLSDSTNHYLLLIQKSGGTVEVWKNNVSLGTHATAATTYAALLSEALVTYCGSDHGYYSNLHVIDGATLPWSTFFELSMKVADLWMCRKDPAWDAPSIYHVGDRTGEMTVTSTFTAAEGTLANLIDGVKSGVTWYPSNPQNGQYVQFTWPAPICVQGFRVFSSTVNTRGLWKWQGSVDGSSDWTDLTGSWTYGGATEWEDTSLNGNADSYKGYRLVLVDNVGGVLSEYQYEYEFKIASESMYGPNGGCYPFTHGVISTGPSIFTGGTPGWTPDSPYGLDGDLMFNGLNEYEWYPSDSYADVAEPKVWYDLGTGVTKRMRYYTIYVPYVVGAAGYPRSWHVKGSDDGVNWVTIDTQYDQHPWDATQDTYKDYEIADNNVGDYRYYQLHVFDACNNSGGRTVLNRIGEWKGYEFGTPWGLGTDFSGQGNHWIVSGEQTSDTPTNNLPTFNPLFASVNTLSNGNRTMTGSDPGTDITPATQPCFDGCYWEVRWIASSGGAVGVYDPANPISGTMPLSRSSWLAANEEIRRFDGTSASSAQDVKNASIVGMAYRDGSLWYAVDGVWLGDPVAGTGASDTTIEGIVYPVVWDRFTTNLSSGTLVCDAGGLEYPAPAGFKPLAARHAPNPEVLDASLFADVVLRTGNDGFLSLFTGGSVSTSGGNYGMTGDGLFDGTNTYAGGTCWNTAVDGWAAYDMGEGNAAPLVRYGFIPDSYYNGGIYSPISWHIDGSNDGEAWSRVDTQADQPAWSGTAERFYTPDDTVAAYRMYRLTIDSMSGAECIIGEWKGYTTAPPVGNYKFAPDFVNIKDLDVNRGWAMYDTARGATMELVTGSTAGETVQAAGLTSFLGDGYSLGNRWSVNHSPEAYVDIALKADPKAGFDVVTYTGDGVAGRQVAHDLGKAPSFMVVKRLDAASEWSIFHGLLGPGWLLTLSAAAAVADADRWNGSWPDSTHFTLGSADAVNALGGSYVAYVFTDSDVFRAFGYTGTGTVDGPVVELGGRLLSIPFLKNGAQVAHWSNFDVLRDGCDNPLVNQLLPSDPSAASDLPLPYCAVRSSGFKVLNSTTQLNGTGDLMVGLAVMRQPFKYSNAF